MLGADQRSQLVQEDRIQRESIARQKQMKEVGGIVIQRAEHRHTEPGVTPAYTCEVRERHQSARILQLSQRKTELEQNAWFRIASERQHGVDYGLRDWKLFCKVQSMLAHRSIRIFERRNH